MVQILPGDAALTVGDRLAALGVVASGRSFENAAKANPHGNALEPGYYRVHKQMKASLALALLLNPASRVQSKVTIPEGFRLEQIIARLGQDTGNLKGYEQAIANPAALGLPAYANGKPEGYLFPATYEVQPKTPPAAVLKSMVQQFNQEAASIGLPAAAAAAQESQGAVITVASLIEAEGKLPSDYPKIAEVIYNRLNASPPIHLQLDTTVLYGMSLKHSKARVQHHVPVAVQHVRARGPAARADRQPRQDRDRGGAAPGARQPAVLPDHQLAERQDAVLLHRHAVRRRGGPVREHGRQHGRPRLSGPAMSEARRLGRTSPEARSGKRRYWGAPIAHSLSPVLHRAAYAGARPDRLVLPGHRVRRAAAARACSPGAGRTGPGCP